MKPVLIIGAKSDIAKALAREFARNGYDLYLTGRNIYELDTFASDLTIRNNITVELGELDIMDFASHGIFYNSLKEKPVGVVSVVGYLGDQKVSSEKWEESLKVIQTNFTGIVSLLNIISNDFEKRKSGFVIGISSVAGDRGRQSNYLYGASKAALTAYLSGLRNRLFKSQVHVMTVKPGFVDTQMTKGMDLPKPLTGSPEKVAKDIYKSLKAKKNIVYTIWIWRFVMMIIRNIPETIFKKLNL